jgi:solute:Na+ symporter, SSS family
MNLSWIDCFVVSAFLAFLFGIALVTRLYSRSVSDFLAGNRCAGRYLLTMSEGVSGMGLVGIVANFEQFYQAGFSAGWWGNVLAPVALVIALSGWVVYRYRETRALTMAQFFEMRYSRRFRIFAGMLAWGSGILNYGIFPSIIARFLIYYCGLPIRFDVGGLSVPTFPVVMFVMLGIAVALALSGGMITIMIIDFFQAQFINLVFLTVMVVLFLKFSWPTVVDTLQNAPLHQSRINPFDQSEVSDFNFWFFLILAFKSFYNCLGWQGSQGYNCAAKSPHEAKMARVLAEWRNGVCYLMIMLLPICAYVLLNGTLFQDEAGAVRTSLASISDPQLRSQMTVPISIAHLLPVGVAGLFLAAMMGSAIGNDITYLHSWGSIFIQDVLLPVRQKELSLKRHLFWLRCSIVGVALFAFCFSLIFPLRDYIYMYFLITGAIYLGGSGAVIIGGLYWRRGTTEGAWAALIAGGVLAAGGALLRALWPYIPGATGVAATFPINGAWMAFIASLSAIAVYVAVSLLTCRKDFDMDRLLHRGAYALPEEHHVVAGGLAAWKKRLGMTDEFTRGDQIIYFFKMGWTLFWFSAFLIGTVAAIGWGIPNNLWADWWLFTISLSAVVGVGTIIWFLWGGLRDLRSMLITLKAEHVDMADDGMVRSELGKKETQAHSPQGSSVIR